MTITPIDIDGIVENAAERENDLDRFISESSPAVRSQTLRDMVRQGAAMNLRVGEALRVVLWMIWKYQIWVTPVDGVSYTKNDWIDTFLKPYLNEQHGFEEAYLRTQMTIIERVVMYVERNRLTNPIVDENGVIVTPEMIVAAPTRSLTTVAPVFTDNGRGGKGSKADHSHDEERDEIIKEMLTTPANQFVRQYRSKNGDKPQIQIEYRIIPNGDGTVNVEMPHVNAEEMALLMARISDIGMEILD